MERALRDKIRSTDAEISMLTEKELDDANAKTFTDLLRRAVPL